MTTADQLRAHVRAKTSPFTELYEKAALELDQRDDAIAQLRAERDTALANAKALGLALDLAGSERDALARERDKFREALTEIASFDEGGVVSGKFDEPRAATRARVALESLAKKVAK